MVENRRWFYSIVSSLFSGSCFRIGFVDVPQESNLFNPCFSGSCFRISGGCTHIIYIESFNPCFSGSCFRIIGDLEKNLELGGFNPCFSGSCFRMHEARAKSAEAVGFNPCLVILLSNRKCNGTHSPVYVFQSLFSGSCFRILWQLIKSNCPLPFQSLF